MNRLIIVLLMLFNVTLLAQQVEEYDEYKTHGYIETIGYWDYANEKYNYENVSGKGLSFMTLVNHKMGITFMRLNYSDIYGVTTSDFVIMETDSVPEDSTARKYSLLDCFGNEVRMFVNDERFIVYYAGDYCRYSDKVVFKRYYNGIITRKPTIIESK